MELGEQFLEQYGDAMADSDRHVELGQRQEEEKKAATELALHKEKIKKAEERKKIPKRADLRLAAVA